MTLLGGASEAAPDAHAHEVASWAVGALSAKEGALSLGRIVSYKTQVVAGINHIMHIETKDAAGATHGFDVTVWEKLPGQQANDGPYELTHSKKVATAQAATPGEWDAAARAALASINARSNSLFPYQLERVLSATPSEDGGAGAVKLLLSAKRGERVSETLAATVAPAADAPGGFALRSFAPQ